jgi:hypothetical protein
LYCKNDRPFDRLLYAIQFTLRQYSSDLCMIGFCVLPLI